MVRLPSTGGPRTSLTNLCWGQGKVLVGSEGPFLNHFPWSPKRGDQAIPFGTIQLDVESLQVTDST